MELTKEVIIRFIENKCSKEEADFLYRQLLDNPQLLDDYLSEEEWENFQVIPSLPPERSEAWFSLIQQQKGMEGKQVNLKRRWLVAAAAILVFSAGILLYPLLLPRKVAPPVAAVQVNVPDPSTRQKKLQNNTNKPVTYTLPDRSVVVLYKNSELIYQEPFEEDKRTIRLQGEAVFRVAKDKQRPFTVFTEKFSTTALGTVFRIKAWKSSRESTIQLVSGKVVVRNLQAAAAPVYLEPGEACTFHNRDNQLKVSLVADTSAAKTPAAAPALKQTASHNQEEVVFSNSPLPEVFDRISQFYHITIATDHIQLEGRKFTGTFLKNQPVADVLATIALLNNFEVVKDSTGYRLTMK